MIVGHFRQLGFRLWNVWLGFLRTCGGTVEMGMVVWLEGIEHFFQ
jgi:hypothetical protein